MKKLKTNYSREIKLIKKSIKKLDVDLSGLTVLTEVGSGSYVISPIIPLLAGAKKVYAWTADSRYGKAADIIEECLEIAKILGVENQIEFSPNFKNPEQVKQADIITNSGFLRPLNEIILKDINPRCVIPLMYEKWELRDSDIDIAYCQQKNIKVAGTWENHPSIGVFTGVGHLAIKLCLEAGMEVYQNNIFIWSDDHFGEETETAFKKFGANKVYHSTKKEEFYTVLESLDILYLCDYDEKKSYFSEGGIFDLKKIKEINSSLTIVHLYGDVDHELLQKNEIKIYPAKRGHASLMTETLAYLGPNLIVNLQVAGYKVAQSMYHGKASDLAQPITY